MSYQRIEIRDANNSHIADGNVTLGAGESKTVTVHYSTPAGATTGIGFTVNYEALSGVTSEEGLIYTADNIADGAASTVDGVTSHTFGYASLFGAFAASGDETLATVTLTNDGVTEVTVPMYLVFTSSDASLEHDLSLIHI